MSRGGGGLPGDASWSTVVVAGDSKAIATFRFLWQVNGISEEEEESSNEADRF